MNIAIIQCRYDSSRLYGKCSLPLAGKSMLFHVIDRATMINVDKVIVATTTEPEDDWVMQETYSNLKAVCRQFDNQDDVLNRFFQIVKEFDPEYVVRITADNPLFDYNKTNKMLEGKSPFMHIDYPVNGLRSEIIKASAIRYAQARVKLDYDREHVTTFLMNASNISKMSYPVGNLKYLRLTVDTEADYLRMKKIYKALYRDGPIELSEVFDYINRGEL